MQIARLFDNNFAGSGRHVNDRKIFRGKKGLHLFGRNIIRKQIEFTVAVAAKINFVTHPLGPGVVATTFRLWNFHHGLILKGK